MAAIRLADFDTWRPGYGGAVVTIFVAGTTTLASVFTDEALTTPASNPITLANREDDGISYGKWPLNGSLYVGQAVEMRIASNDQTGIVRPPIGDLTGEDASNMVVTATGGSEAVSLDDVVARTIHVEDYGALVEGGGSGAANNASISSALGVAAANGGGEVIMPPGIYTFTSFTIAAGVILRGAGRGVTILQSQTADKCITLGGDRAGLRAITIDGVNNTVGGVGCFAKKKNELVFDDVDVKRFATGIHFKGGRRLNARNLYLTNNTDGAKFHGDNDAGNGADGDDFMFNEWSGGRVQQHSGIGVDFSFEDKKCWHNCIRDVGFEDNTGTALRVNGARYLRLENCWWDGNTTTLAVLDDTDATPAYRLLNTILGLQVLGGAMDNGAVTLRDTLLDVEFCRVDFTDVDFTLTSPGNAVILKDCGEDSACTVSGTATYLSRWYTTDHGATSGVTTDNVATKAWAMTLEPGQTAILRGHVLGTARNATTRRADMIRAFAFRPGSTLAYDGQTVNFTVGQVLTGSVSGATARIIADSDSGATGTLTLKDITGVFVDNETITDGAGGTALANGALTHQNCSLDGNASATVMAGSTNMNNFTQAAFVANGPEIELRVTGASSTTVDWVVDVDVTTNP